MYTDKSRNCLCGSDLIPNWEYDGNGIPLCKVCDECRDEQMSKYRVEIVSAPYDQSQVDEQIDEDL